MKWKNIFNEKGNRGLLLGSIVAILLIMVMIRHMNKNHLSELQQNVASIYEDRLVAKGYIFEVSKKIHSKKILVKFENEFLEASIQTNDSIQQIIKDYEKTLLTKDEELLLAKLKGDIRMSEQFESKFLHNLAEQQRQMITVELTKHYNLILSDLERLSEIQLNEGKKLLDNSYQIVASSNSTSQLEIALIIVLMLIVIKIISAPKIQVYEEWQP